MLLEAENTQRPGLGAWLTLLGQESGGAAVVPVTAPV